MELLGLILPAVLPVVVDGVKALINRLTGGGLAQPASVDEAIRLMQADAERLKALAQLDAPAANISQWVADLRASFRYLAAGVIILGVLVMFTASAFGAPVDADVLSLGLQLMGSVFAFIFGDRLYAHLRLRR